LLLVGFFLTAAECPGVPASRGEFFELPASAAGYHNLIIYIYYYYTMVHHGTVLYLA
jgi:hypothetical protein